MKDTPKWMTAAGNDIMNCISEGDELDTYPSVDDFAAIIQRHYPDDKAGKLAAILKQIIGTREIAPSPEHFIGFERDIPTAKTALVDYEEKQT